MDDILGDDLPLPPGRLFERLAQVPHYTWDQSFTPFHSTYDHWHVYGVYHNPEHDTAAASSSAFTTRSGYSSSNRSSPKLDQRPSNRHHWSSISGASVDSDVSSSRTDPDAGWMPVIARISTHVLRLEREYNYNKATAATLDPEHLHTFRTVDIFRLPSTPGDPNPMLVCVYEAPGKNYLREVLNFGPAFYGFHTRHTKMDRTPGEQMPLQTFLDFAIGASETLELLHHGAKAVHGEIRQDTFLWTGEGNAVRLANTGNGPRSFENLLSSEGWATLSREIGVKNKLQFIAPEQTGRLPADPDSRTDIYSLGVLFWTILTRQPAFEADTPIDIVQRVLSSRLPMVSSMRMDVPIVIAHIIAKMTQKQMDDRYHSITGLKWDLAQVAKFLGEGEQDKVRDFVPGQRDVSSFFILPCKTFGRHLEIEKISKIIGKAHKRVRSGSRKDTSGNAMYSTASNSSFSETRNDVLDVVDGSDSSSSFGVRESRSNSTTIGLEPQIPTGRASMLTIGRGIADPRPNFLEVSDRDSQWSGPHRSESLISMSRRSNSQKIKRRGRTESILLLGPQGVGKSTLIKSVQPQIRRYGYLALGRFDKARPTPFEPLLKVLGSLFRQIFSERDVNTPYHELLRAHVRPIWAALHVTLDLPETLLEAALPSKKLLLSSDTGTPSIRTEPQSLDSRGIANSAAHVVTPRDANDFLRGPANTKSIRLINTYMDVLRLMCTGKLICVSLDDLHAADEESIDLIQNIIKARIPIVLLLASRKDGQEIAAHGRSALDLDWCTRIELGNLREKHVFEYVASTMSQSIDDVLPLAAVIYEKSAGNPFLVKEILQTCYERNCLWYDWRSSCWQYDLDKIFNELSSCGNLDSSFVTRRFSELPPAGRSILAWASLIGIAFSFKLIQRLLSGEHYYSSGRDQSHDVTCPKRAKLFNISKADCIDGLQQLLNLYILVPGETDDEFRFAHARYLHAANEMRECQNTTKMHFILAQTMLSYLSECKYNLYPLARHICLAATIIKERVRDRRAYRDVLWRGAQKATESGARSTALWYFRTCVQLLCDNAWDDSNSDCSYDETIQLYVNTAELMSLEGEQDEALTLLSSTFANARCPADKTRSYILQGKILSQKAQFREAFTSLKTCLEELGFALPPTTWDECDIEFKKLEFRIRGMNRADILAIPLSEDKSLIALGTVLSEAAAASYWSMPMVWYQLVIAYVKVQLDRGTFIQAGIGYGMLGTAAIGRFRDIELGLLCGEIAQDFYALFDDPWTRGRGWTLYAIFLSHFQIPIPNVLPILENSLDYSLASGDRNLCMLNLGSMAFYRLAAGQDLAEIEAFCNYGPEEFGDWESDVRGGTLLVATRQIARALQGKTGVNNVNTVLDDDHHNQADYKAMCIAGSLDSARSLDLYQAITLAAYFSLGYHDYVIEVGRRLIKTTLDHLWSHRPAAAVRFFLGLSLMKVAQTLPDEERAQMIQEAKECKQFIDNWGSVQDVNYFCWSRILAGEIAVTSKVYYDIISNFEAAIDHCQVHGFSYEEAIALELQADFLLARGAKRAGKVMVQESISAWNRVNAHGKSRQLADKHEWLIKAATNARTMDMSTQTTDVAAVAVVEGANILNKREWTRSWVEPKDLTSDGPTHDVPGMGLDILDLTSILEFSRVISSELQINALLSKMTAVILESVGGQAEFCAIVIDSEDQGWCVAASGAPDSGVKTYPDGIPFAEVDDQVAQHITHYILRTKETVFLPNVLEDERFSNVSEQYLTRNPNGRSIICIPIIQADHLMGVIHLEGKANAFTQRNMVVLNLLTNQVAISLGNALLYRKVRKVSASNATMVESQKRALAAAREAEAKAKRAEAEAMRNVKLAEEAAKAKSIFLANVSHELRTPLNGVIGMSELLKSTPLSKDQEGYADSIRVCADTLLTVINDILDFSKLEAGKMQMFTVPINLKETITEVVRALAYTNHEHGLQTIEDFVLDENLVLGDPVRLHQIFMNLLSNAYKFTAKGAVTVKARKTSETKDRVKITCSVADTGIGITEEQLTRLFQPFSQADSSTARSYGGSGLGLSICKAIIENVLGGKIWIESKPGVGTTVFFTLAFQKAPKDSSVPNDMKISAKDPDPMANWSKSDNPGEETRVSFCDLSKIPREGLRVCIAEDNAINRKIAVSYVTKIGLKCEAFEDGKLAYEALQQRSKEGNPFHLVLMDVQMPVLDGYEATKAIRADSDSNVSQVLIIAMTASAIRGDREKCLEAGMNDYLAKPVRQTVLKAMLDEYLNNSRPVPATIEKGSGSAATPANEVNGSGTVASNSNAVKETNGEAKPKENGLPIRKNQVPSKEGAGLSESTNRSTSPPSGKRETDEIGRISREAVQPAQTKRATLEIPKSLANGENQTQAAPPDQVNGS